MLGERIRIRRHDYTVVGLTRRMVSSGGDPMVFVALKDAQEAQFLKDNDAIVNDRLRTAANPAFNRPGVPGLLDAVQAAQASSRNWHRGWTPILLPNPYAAGSTCRSTPARAWKTFWWPS